MDLLVFNSIWMFWNLFLAFVGLYFGWKLFRATTKIKKSIFATLWLLFIPNTVYILTDIIHIPKQMPHIPVFLLPVWMLQFTILFALGIWTYVVGLYLFEKVLAKYLFHYAYLTIIPLNFLISFGVVMGRVQRTNSWYVVTDPMRVIIDMYRTFSAPELILFTFIFGITINLLYFIAKQFFP